MRRSHLPSDVPAFLFSGPASLRLCARPNPFIPRKSGGRSPPYRCRPVVGPFCLPPTASSLLTPLRGRPAPYSKTATSCRPGKDSGKPRNMRTTRKRRGRGVSFRIFSVFRGSISFGGGRRLLRLTESSHLVFLASIFSEEDVSPENTKEYISRGDAGTQSSEWVSILPISAPPRLCAS
jgi:hypothetical protein